MQQLINDLLAFSRVGRLVPSVSDVDLERVPSGRRSPTSSAPVEETGADDHPGRRCRTVRGEAPLLDAVFQNLVGNALKFHGRRTAAPGAHRRRPPAATTWEFSCADNGIGIEPEYAERIFVIFQRLHPKDVYGGTGIGLAMCRKIVEYHGGRIWVDTAVTEGTTIRWTLPAIAGRRDDSRRRRRRPR